MNSIGLKKLISQGWPLGVVSNHLTMGKQKSSGSFNNGYKKNYSFTNHIHLIYLHMYKQDLALKG